MVQMLGWFRAEAARASRPKAFECLRFLCDIVGKEFQRDEAAELGVLSLIDNTHAAATELLDDAVVRDGLAEHWRESYV